MAKLLLKKAAIQVVATFQNRTLISKYPSAVARWHGKDFSYFLMPQHVLNPCQSVELQQTEIFEGRSTD